MFMPLVHAPCSSLPVAVKGITRVQPCSTACTNARAVQPSHFRSVPLSVRCVRSRFRSRFRSRSAASCIPAPQQRGGCSLWARARPLWAWARSCYVREFGLRVVCVRARVCVCVFVESCVVLSVVPARVVLSGVQSPMLSRPPYFFRLLALGS